MQHTTMTKASYAEFDEFEASLYGVNGRYMLRSAQRRDWRLRVLELNGVALMAGQEGAATIYSGAGMPGCFNLFLPLSGHECTVVDGPPVRPPRNRLDGAGPHVPYRCQPPGKLDDNLHVMRARLPVDVGTCRQCRLVMSRSQSCLDRRSTPGRLASADPAPALLCCMPRQARRSRASACASVSGTSAGSPCSTAGCSACCPARRCARRISACSGHTRPMPGLGAYSKNSSKTCVRNHQMGQALASGGSWGHEAPPTPYLLTGFGQFPTAIARDRMTEADTKAATRCCAGS